MTTPPSSDDCHFDYEPLTKDDITYEHDYTVNIGDYTVTYCIQLLFQTYKQGECIGIKSLIPGQKLSQRKTATYSKIVYDESGKQIALADSTTSESELIGSVSNNLNNILHSASTDTTTNKLSWSATVDASVDVCGIGSIGGSVTVGNEHTTEDIITSVSDTIETIITNSVSKTKNSKASSNLANFNSLHTTTESQSITTDTVDVIENLSKSKIAIYHFYTMYKKYECRQFIKKIKNNCIIKYITRYNPAFLPTFLPHKSNQTSNIDTLAKILPLCKDASEIIKVNALIGENGLIGTNGTTLESRKVDVVNKDGSNTLIGPDSFRNNVITQTQQQLNTNNITQPQSTTKGSLGATTTDFTNTLSSLNDPVITFQQIDNLNTSVNMFKQNSQTQSLTSSSGSTSSVTLIPDKITELLNAKKNTEILLPIDGYYMKGENTCLMLFTTNKEIEGL